VAIIIVAVIVLAWIVADTRRAMVEVERAKREAEAAEKFRAGVEAARKTPRTYPDADWTKWRQP